MFSREEKDHFGLGSFYHSEMQAVSRDDLPSSNKASVSFSVHYQSIIISLSEETSEGLA